MKNIKFDSALTENKVKELELLTNDIETNLREIYFKYLELDDKYWKSKNKDKLDEILINYLSKISHDYPNDIRSLNKILNQYVVDYKDTFEFVKNLLG